MRGKDYCGQRSARALGITPAYAGKSVSRGHAPPAGWDHPRVCGEKFDNPKIVYSEKGSPPRMRGKVIRGLATRITSGITPAYAGKSGRGVLLLSTFWDHPRVCGEKFCYVPSLYNLLGSPPRMRGKGHMVFQFFPAHGITPAYAGKSSHSGKRWCFLWDHPRVCGEKQRKWMLRTFIRGSPPRMRGKVLPRAVLGPASGITPAYAGKRQRFSSRCECRGDHPRVCGEKPGIWSGVR